MPCPCEIRNGTNLLQSSGTLFGLVLDNGSQCFKPDNLETSTAIGNANFDPHQKYTYKRILTKAEAAQTCYRKSKFWWSNKRKLNDVCDLQHWKFKYFL